MHSLHLRHYRQTERRPARRRRLCGGAGNLDGHHFGGKAGGVFFCASDIGWVVGHSYIVYAPLLAGMATIVYEGLPTYPDCGVWWKIVEKYRVNRMFSAPTAIRVLKNSQRRKSAITISPRWRRFIWPVSRWTSRRPVG